MRRTVINSVLTLSFLVFSTALFAIDKKELKKELFRVDETAILQENNEINITVNSKPYSGFLGTVVEKASKHYSNDEEGAIQELLDNWGTMTPNEQAKAYTIIASFIDGMSYEELKNINGKGGNAQIEDALYLSWLTTQRAGNPQHSVSRSTTTESEPNNDMSSANAMATDTVSAYLTAYDEDWYSFTVSGGGDWALETHATSADDNAGDTKLYLYAANSSTNYVEYDDDGGSGGYSKIAHRFEDAVTPTSNLFFSEYAEGSSNNKYLEIYNGTGAEVSLDDYVILGNYNGNPWSEAFTFAAGATIENGGVYVIANSSASSEIQAQADELLAYGAPWYTVSFNGDDARALAQISGTDTTILDIIGTLEGGDPGSGWEVAGTSNATKDHTLVRKGSVTGGNTSWSASAGTNTTDSEWEVADRPTATYTPSTLGSHTITAANEYYIKVTGYSGTYAGAYLLTVTETAFSSNHDDVVINEIHYNPATSQGDDSDYEFLELYNTSTSDIDLTGWTVGEAGHASNIASLDGITISAGSYVVVAYTGATYSSLTVPVVDNSGYFGLGNGGKALELLDNLGALVDHVTYDDNYPSGNGWPNEPDGGGTSLELINAALDNNDGSNWRGWGINGGTPGAANSAQPDISAGSSIAGYVAVGSSVSGAFQLNNNGDADLTVSSVTVDSQYVAGLGSYLMDDILDTPSSWSTKTTTVEVTQTAAIAVGVTLDLTIDTDSYGSEGSATLTSPNSTVVTLFSSFTDGTYSLNMADFDGESPNGTWTLTVLDSWGDGGHAVTGIVLGVDASPGTNIDPTVGGAGVPAWLSVTVPSAGIAAGDSGDVTVSFDASLITENVSYSTTVNIINNDPQDSSYSFTVTINAMADTAILDLTTASYIWNPSVAGDSTGSYGTVTIQNDGGSNLVLDSVGYAIGTHWYDDAVDSTVVEANEATTFKVYYYPQSSGIHRDTLVVHTNTDSSSAGVVTMKGYAYPDTNYQVEDAYSDIAADWTTSSYTGNSSYGYGYFTSASAGYLISTQVAVSAGDELMLKLVNGSATDSKYRVYFANSAAATQWSGWTLIDSVEIPAGSTTWDYYAVDLGFTAADTGYIGITFNGAAYYYVIDDVVIPPDVPEPASPGLPPGYTLEGFDSGVPEGWTLQSVGAGFVATSSGQTGSGVYHSDNSGTQDDWLITQALDLTGYTNPYITYWEKNAYASYYVSHEVVVSTDINDMANGTQLTTGVAPTSWTKKTVDLSAYVGTTIYVGFHYEGNWADAWYIDEVLLPWELTPTANLSSAPSLNFYGVAVDTAAGTGSHSLATTISNTGTDTLTGTIASRSTDFTVSPATIDLLPDSSMTVTVTYAPSATGFDSSYVDFTSNSSGVAGTKDSMQVLGYAFEADVYNHFEFAVYDSSGFVRQNTAGGTYWTNNTSTSSLGGTNSIFVSSHKYGGETWLITPQYTIDADGERLSWNMKTNDATPTTTSILYLELLTGNTFADLENAVTLDSIVVSASASDVTEEWLLYFVDVYNLTDNAYYFGLRYVDESSGGSSATGAGLYIDNISFANAPEVPILSLGSAFNAGVTFIDSGFVSTAVTIGQNTGGDTLFISTVTSDDASLTVSVVSDTILPQGAVKLNFSLDSADLVMGVYSTTITLVHNDTSFSTGSDDFIIKADFTYTLESFEDGFGVIPDGWKDEDADGDGNGWTFGSTLMSSDGSRASYSSKALDQSISDNWLISPLYSIEDSSNMLIFDAHYSSAVDPDFMKVMVSDDLGNTWDEVANVSMMGVVNWTRYEYNLADYVGSDVRFAIVDVNYGNSTSDRLWVDRFLLPNKTDIKPIAFYRSMNTDGSYVWDDSLALVKGIVTVSDQYGGPSYIQDDSAGIAVYANDFRDGVSVGDMVIVRGELTVYAGLLELSYTGMAFSIESSGHVVTPKLITLETLQDSSVAEAHEGMLLKVDRLAWADTSDWNSGGNGFTIGVDQGDYQIDVRVDNTTDLNDVEEPPDGIFDMVAVLGQFHFSNPFAGYQLMPRSVDDIELYAEYHGIVTDVATGAALGGVVVVTDVSSDTSDADGGYITASSFAGTSLSFSKDGYTPATFTIDASGGGFTQMDAGLYPSPDSVIYINGFETASDAGFVDDTSSNVAGTQWVIVDSLQASMYVSSGVYLDTLIFPASGSKMIALNDLNTTNGDTGYVDDSYSLWYAPGVVDLAGFTGVSQKTISMDIWTDTESCCDDIRVLVKSAANTTGSWMILGERSGNTGEWVNWALDLAPVDTMTDAQFALLFFSDYSIVRGFGALVDNIQVGGRDIFVALAPSNLTASIFEDNEVNLAWSAPGVGGRVGYQFIDIYDDLEAPSTPIERKQAATSKEKSMLSSLDAPQQTHKEWVDNKRKENPKFNTHPKPYFKTVEIEASDINRSNSRSMTYYNVFRKTEGSDDFVLFDTAPVTGSVSGSYVDTDVANYTKYHYYVTAVYNEGESGSSNTDMGVPGLVVEELLPLHEEFEALSGALPDNWSTENADDNDWSTGDAENASGTSLAFPYHGEFAFINNEESGSPAMLVTPFFRHENVIEAAYLKFETYVEGSYPNCDVMVRNSYGPWTVVASLSSTADEWATVMLDISEYVVGNNYVQIGFEYDELYSWSSSGWGIDNVKIGLEPGPDNLTAHAHPGEIRLDWGMTLNSAQDPGGSPVGFDEDNRPIYLIAPNCEDCEPLDNARIPEILFGADFDFDEPTQFVEYDAVLDTTTDLSSDEPTNWGRVYSDANSSGSFDEGDPSWLRYSWSPSLTDFDQWVISDNFDATGEAATFLMFDEYLDDFSGIGDTVAAHVSNDGGVTWTTVWEMADSSWYAPSGPEGYWSRHVIPVGAGTAQMKVAFSMRGATTFNIDYWHVDNIFILNEIPQDQYTVFNVTRDGELIAEDIETTTYVDSDVEYGDDYCYQIQQKHISYPEGDVVVSGLSNTACATPENQNPTAPGLLIPVENDTVMIVMDDNGNYVDEDNNVGLTFSWSESIDPDAHEIMYYFIAGGEFEFMLDVFETTDGLSFQVPYNVLVPAIESIGEFVASGTWAIGASDNIGELIVSEERFLVIDAGYALSIDEEALPDVFALHQNYPNPFNPITTIRFDVPEESRVRMDIYNVLGQRVRTLMNGTMQPGFHAVRWDGTNDMGKPLASGMYIYRIQSSKFASVKKLVLMK